jgi:HAD superfamily hydrolase (TIGR01509 family)
MRFGAVIFDFDGLMIDSEGIALQVWQQLVGEYGAVLTAELYSKVIGKAPSLGAAFIQSQLELPVDPNTLKDRYWEQRTVIMSAEAPASDGLPGLIEFLLGAKIPLGVASNSPTFYVERVLAGLNLRHVFSSVLGSDRVTQGKPAPDLYLLSAADLSVAPEKCLVIEDSPTGVTAAKAAGMTCYAVPNRDLPDGDFSQADEVFESLHRVQEHLQQEAS